MTGMFCGACSRAVRAADCAQRADDDRLRCPRCGGTVRPDRPRPKRPGRGRAGPPPARLTQVYNSPGGLVNC